MLRAEVPVRPILNLADVELTPVGNGGKFQAKRGEIGRKIGARRLGYGLVVVPPGKRAWPHHHHYGNEEMFYVLEGEGLLRFGTEEHPLRVGDVIACPPGGPDVAHQIVNTGSAPLRYLAVSTSDMPEVVGYPDSDKIGCIGAPPGSAFGAPDMLRHISRRGDAAGYFDGEG